MFRKLAAAAVLVVLAAGPAARGADRFPNRFSSDDPDESPFEFFDVYATEGLTDVGANRLYDSPGDDTLYDSPGDDTFFHVFMEKPIIDNGDPGVMTGALWLELLGW